MIIKRNKDRTFDITGVSLGKLMAIVSAIDKLEANGGLTSSVTADIRDLIKNNPEYNKSLAGN